MPKQFKIFKWTGKKAVAFLCISVALTAAVVGTTIAYLKTKSNTVNVEYDPLTVSVTRSNDGKSVINDGEADVYVRAAMIFTWKSTTEENSIMSTVPVAGVNYDLTVAEGWAQAADGFWYYLKPLPAKETRNAISSVTLKGAAPAGYELSVELLFDAIQADPTTAVTESWASGVESIDTNGALVLKQNQQ